MRQEREKLYSPVLEKQFSLLGVPLLLTQLFTSDSKQSPNVCGGFPPQQAIL